MIILGIDPGYGTTGYGVIEKTRDTLKPVDYGVITTSKHESMPVRLAEIDKALSAIIKKYRPDDIAIEELFFNTNITTGIKVAEARGVMVLCAVKECGRLYEYTPLQIKQAITGNGRAEKAQIQYMVRALLKLPAPVKPDDAADALACAICHANTHQLSERVLK